MNRLCVACFQPEFPGPCHQVRICVLVLSDPHVLESLSFTGKSTEAQLVGANFSSDAAGHQKAKSCREGIVRALGNIYVVTGLSQVSGPAQSGVQNCLGVLFGLSPCLILGVELPAAAACQPVQIWAEGNVASARLGQDGCHLQSLD